MLVCLVLYAYWVGVFSRRKIALACARTLAVLAIVGQDRPACHTISDFRTLPLEVFKDVCGPVVRLAAEAGLGQWGHGATEGTKSQGNASRPKAMSYGDRKKEVERLRADLEALVTQAYQQDEADDAAWGRRRGDALPAEWARREDRLARIEAAMRRWEAQAKAEAEAARQRRADAEAERQRTGKQRRGQAPKPVQDSRDDKAQSHFPDPELHIMRTHNKGWDSCGNAQASVDGACQLSVACDVTEAAHDQQQAEPVAQATLATLNQAGLERPKDAAGAVQAMPATLDKGDDSAAAVVALETLGCAPYMATGRQRHQSAQAAAPELPVPVQERMAATIRTAAGKAWYARRTVIVEPVCGQSKEARGCRRFLLRGLATIRGEGRLVCLTHNLRKLWRYGRVRSAIEAMMARSSLGVRGPLPERRGAEEPPWLCRDKGRSKACPIWTRKSTCQTRVPRAANANSRTDS